MVAYFVEVHECKSRVLYLKYILEHNSQGLYLKCLNIIGHKLKHVTIIWSPLAEQQLLCFTWTFEELET